MLTIMTSAIDFFQLSLLNALLQILRNATDERVVVKLYGSPAVSREKVQQIGQMPVAELNSLIHQANLTEAEASLIRDIRRRSKNKVAARNCRKRKLDTISQLEVEVNELHAKRARLEQERDRVRTEALRYKQCVYALRRFIVKSLRAAARTNVALSGSQLLDNEGVSDFLSSLSGAGGLTGSQSDLFASSSFGFDAAGAKPSASSLGPLAEDGPATSMPLDLIQESIASSVAPGLTRYASVSSMTTEPPQAYASSMVPELLPSSLPPMTRGQIGAMPISTGEMDASLATLLPSQPGFPQAPTAPVGVNLPFGSWNTAALFL